MKTWRWTAGAVALAWIFSTGAAQAQNLSGRDRMLLYYSTFYQQQQNQKFQASINNQFAQQGRTNAAFASSYLTRQSDPFEMSYLHPELNRPQRSQTPLPPIYSGRGGQNQYFMRVNHFNVGQTRRSR